MKKLILCVLTMMLFSNVSAAQKFLLCKGKLYDDILNLEDGTGKQFDRQITKPEDASKIFVLENGKLYDPELNEISGCKVTHTLIYCDHGWKNSWDPDFQTLFNLKINRINGEINLENFSKEKYVTKDNIQAFQINKSYFKGLCEIKKETKF